MQELLLYYVFVPKIRNPCSSCIWGRKKRKTLGRRGWGKQTREHCPALLPSLNKGMQSITNQGQIKTLPYTRNWNFKKGYLMAWRGKKMRIPNSAFEFQLLPHSETWPEVCHTVDVLERKKESPIVSGYCSQKIMDPWPHHHFSRGLMPYL